MKFKKILLHPLDIITACLLPILLFSFVYFSIIFIYNDELSHYEGTIITEKMENSFAELINAADTLYDPLTKRAVGKINRANKTVTDGKTVIRMEVSLYRKPRSMALRNEKVFFEFEYSYQSEP